MWRRCAYLLGVLLIVVAIAAVPSPMIVESYVGGSAIHGSVENGCYFVNPGHSQPIVEVSESTWRAVYWVERLAPFSALVPGLIGLFLVGYAKGPNRLPPPVPPPQLPPRVLWMCLVSGWIIMAAIWLCWVIVRTPWVVMVFGWIVICLSVGTVVLLYSRSLRRPSTTEPGTVLESTRGADSGSS
jgi:hypothetical protein